MKIFQLQSNKLPEPVTFKYNSKGLLTAFESDGLSTKQLEWVYDHFPVNLESVEILRKKHKLNFIETNIEVDFDMFFDKYSNYKGERRDRKIAEQRWNKLSKANQAAAFEYIPRYFASLKGTITKPKYAKTYIHNEPWND